MFIDKLVRDDKRVIPIKPLLTFDVSVIAFVIIIIVLWLNGFVEIRNQNFNLSNSEDESTVSEEINMTIDEGGSLEYDSSINTSQYDISDNMG